MNEAQKNFLKYVRTKMFFKTQLRNLEGRQPVYVSNIEIRTRFFPRPHFQPGEEIESLVKSGELAVHESAGKGGNVMLLFEALRPGGIDVSLLRPPIKSLDTIHQKMRDTLKFVSLLESSPRTDFFDLYLRLKEHYLGLFFNVDEFSGRVHTPISNLHREMRTNILLSGEATTSIDVCTMQPFLLGKILREEIGDNELSDLIDSGADIYEVLRAKAGLPDRDSGKKRFFELIFAPANPGLAELFGYSRWIDWVNTYKSGYEPRNPHSKLKPHSNLAWLLQNNEVSLMKKVWTDLVNHNILFLSVHDEIIVRKRDKPRAETIMRRIFAPYFTQFKLKCDQEHPYEYYGLLIYPQLPQGYQVATVRDFFSQDGDLVIGLNFLVESWYKKEFEEHVTNQESVYKWEEHIKAGRVYISSSQD